MAHFINIIKATNLKSQLIYYIKEKESALNADELDYESSKKRDFNRKFEKSWLTTFICKIKTPKTFENFVFTSFIGFTGGVLLTCILFCFLYIGVRFSLRTTTNVCVLASIVLSLGFAFSSKVRCYVLLLLPVFFSKEGRQALLVYALFLSFTGPAKNTMHNLKILSDSMICEQEIVKSSLSQLVDMVKAPFKSIKETLQIIQKSLQEAVKPVRNFVMKIQKVIVCILRVIKNATSWLGSIVNFCNKTIGTPFQRCMKSFDEAITDCRAKLGVMNFLCHVVHTAKGLCNTVKWLDFICLFTDFVSDKIIGVVKKKLREFNLHMKNLFYVSIEFSHSYKFQKKTSKTTKEVAQTIFKKLSEKVERIQNFFSFCGFMFNFFFIYVFFKAYYYKFKYLSSDSYDNVYINKYIMDLDKQRAQMDRETVLPLEQREKQKFGKAGTIRLLKDEKVRITQSMSLLTLTTFKIVTFLAIDYGLFWILLRIYEAGRLEYEEVEKSKIGIHVQGKGVLVDFYQSLGKAFQVPENRNLRLSLLRCLPDPFEPDVGRYIQIGFAFVLTLQQACQSLVKVLSTVTKNPTIGTVWFLVCLCWILTLTEAYGLRLRNVVMTHYYPDRARERAVWLYNHILRSRGSFLRYARRQLRKKCGGADQKSVEKVTFIQSLFVDFPLLRSIFRNNKANNCLLCGVSEAKIQPSKRCKTPDCPGRYCLQCFAALQNVCTACQQPVEYGDISDISEEVDSSEEELYKNNQIPKREYDSDELQEYNKFKSFKDMESRDRFRDVEAHRVPDYAKLGDLYHDKAALQARLKEVINRHILNTEKEKNRQTQVKRSDYQKVKTKLQNFIYSLQQKKLRQLRIKKSELKAKFKEKINNIKKLRNKKENADEKLLGETSKPPKVRVLFKAEEPKINYKNFRKKTGKKLNFSKKDEDSQYSLLSESSE